MKFWKLNEPVLLFILACICLAVTGFLFSTKIGLLIISIELFVMAFISYERGVKLSVISYRETRLGTRLY